MKAFLVGAGPGDPGLLTLKGRDVLAMADAVVYDALASPTLLEYARPDAELIYVGKIAGEHALPQDEINALLVRLAKEGKTVARLKGGDPYIFGRGGEEALALLDAGVPFEEVPGVSSAIAAPAYAGIPLTHRGLASSVTIITGHESADKSASEHNWKALATGASTLVFVMGMKNLPDIAHNLIRAGLAPDMPAAAIYRGTTSGQRSLLSTLAELPQAAEKAHFSNPAVIVVGKAAALRDKLNWFERKPLFGKSVVVTRAREQASSLARLLEEMGAEVIQFPTIEIRPLADYAKLDAALAGLSGYNWLVFTSANGVRHFWRRLEKSEKDGRALAACKIAAIGPATAQALAARGILADFVPGRYVAESVAEGLRHAGPLSGAHILLPRAARARDVLPDELAAAGANVTVVPCYETVPADSRKDEVQKRIEAGTLSCVTFGSSSTVLNFLARISPELLRAHPETRLAAIGPVTAQTLRDHGLDCHIQPEEYTIPALARVLESELPCL
ncbi:MAG: uroporphyrinogen-III C-methyltransferase [Desulfovibrio sp.]|jgi:uroporphyrinogen III methyltransferase/synthase|nr:uroporphyrinogen-III C-methyltransferase [Desulfovibrio sp.]